MELKDAIDEVKRVTPETDPWTGWEIVQHGKPDHIDEAIATILNAVVKGELVAAHAIRHITPSQSLITLEVKSFGAKQIQCATEGCTEPAIDHIIMGGVGSDYCLDCSDKVIAARNKDQPK